MVADPGFFAGRIVGKVGVSQSLAHDLVEPLGITAFVLLVLTVVFGFIVKKNRKVFLKLHLSCAMATLLSALVHAVLVIISE